MEWTPTITNFPYNHEKVLVFTWDDANYTHFYMAIMFAINRLRATHFINTYELDRHHGFYHYLYRLIQPLGIEFGSHTVHHADITQISKEEVEKELKDSIEDIKKYFGVIPSVFSHPTSSYNPETDEIIKKYFLDSRYSCEKDCDSSWEFLHIRHSYTYDFYKQRIDEFAHSNKTYYIYGGHGLDGYGYEPMKCTILWRLLRLLKKSYYANKFWITTFGELALYRQLVQTGGVQLALVNDKIIIDKTAVENVLSRYSDTRAILTISLPVDITVHGKVLHKYNKDNHQYITIDLRKTDTLKITNIKE